jgi:hypothetical protein
VLSYDFEKGSDYFSQEHSLGDQCNGEEVIAVRYELKITLVGKKKPLAVKIQGDSYSFDIAESKYDSQF